MHRTVAVGVVLASLALSCQDEHELGNAGGSGSDTPNTAGSSAEREPGAVQGIPCVADDVCYIECAADPDCAGSNPGSAGAGDELVCASQEKLCEGECVRTNLPDYGCADPNSCAPCYVVHGEAGCTVLGNCAISSCDPPHWDCNEQYGDGCEVNRDNDPQNCGACGYICAVQEPEVGTHAEITCAAGNCVIRICDAGYGDCDGLRQNGCETELDSSNEHCGECDSPCAETEECRDGTCVAI